MPRDDLQSNSSGAVWLLPFFTFRTADITWEGSLCCPRLFITICIRQWFKIKWIQALYITWIPHPSDYTDANRNNHTINTGKDCTMYFFLLIYIILALWQKYTQLSLSESGLWLSINLSWLQQFYSSQSLVISLPPLNVSAHVLYFSRYSCTLFTVEL